MRATAPRSARRCPPARPSARGPPRLRPARPRPVDELGACSVGAARRSPGSPRELTSGRSSPAPRERGRRARARLRSDIVGEAERQPGHRVRSQRRDHEEVGACKVRIRALVGGSVCERQEGLPRSRSARPLRDDRTTRVRRGRTGASGRRPCRQRSHPVTPSSTSAMPTFCPLAQPARSDNWPPVTATYRNRPLRRLLNVLVRPLARLGLAGKRTHVLTVVGRRSGSATRPLSRSSSSTGSAGSSPRTASGNGSRTPGRQAGSS